MATSVQDFLKANAGYVGQANTANRTKAPVAAPKQRGKGGFLSSIISELGGAGGAWGGAAAGAAAGSVVPGIGNIIGGVLGAGIGGFAGAFGGKAIENKVRDNQNFTGAGGSAKSAFTEGAISGALGAAGKGYSAAKGLKAVGGLNELKALTGGGSDLASASKSLLNGGKKAGLALAGESVDGRLASGASRLESRALGFGQGEKIAGQQVKPKDVKELFAVMKTEGIKSGHPDVVGRQVESKIGKVGELIDSALTSANRPLTSAEQSFVKNKFATQVANDIVLSSDASAQKLATTLSNKIGKISSLEDLVKARRAVQEGINFTRNAAVAEPAKEKVFQLAQKSLNDLSSSVSPELKALNSRFAGLSKLEEATLNSSKNLTSQSRSGMGGIVGGLKAGDTATAAKARAGEFGRGLSGLGGTINNSIPATIAKGAAVRGLANNMMMPGTVDQTQPDQLQTTDTMYDPTVSQDMGQSMQQEQPQQPQYTLADALNDSRRDPKNSSQYLAYAKAFQDQADATTKSTQGGPNITKVTGQQYVLASRGANAVNELEQLLSSSPQTLNKTATPGRKLPGIGGFISNVAGTGKFDAIGYNVANALLRLETGAQANPEEIKNLQAQMMPRAGDSQQTVQIKLDQLRQAFSAFLNTANGEDTLSGQISDYQPTYGGQ